MKDIKLPIPLLVLVFLTCTVFGQEKTSDSYEATFTHRLNIAMEYIQDNPWPSPVKNVDFADGMALLLLFKNENVEEANRLILAFCGRDPLVPYAGKRVPKVRCESLFRIYLLERTRKLLSTEARKAIEDHAWELLTKYNQDITRADANKPFWDFHDTENHYLNNRRRYTLALSIVRMAKGYGPQTMLEGETIDSHCQAWEEFWVKYFYDRANEGIDLEVAHPSSYGLCTIGVYYDLYDLIDNTELRELAGKFLTLFWAEVASEFEPRTGQRAGWATSRMPLYDGMRVYWAQSLLYCYNWHENAFTNNFLGQAPFLTSSYRPPEVVSAIARDRDRGSYLATSRRAGMIEKADGGFTASGGIIFDENGNSHIRRDVYYTPDYALSTMMFDPNREYDAHMILAQTMGATFASDQQKRITVMGTGYYSLRAIVGITGAAVSIISRDPKTWLGRGRFKSDGTRVFISNGDLWDNRVEDASGWFFTKASESYVAIRASGQGYSITNKTYIWPDRKLKEVEEKNGHFLELKDMWAPLVIQMGRAVDYKSFDAFCASVKDNRFLYENGKLTYVSEANERYEYWAKIAQPPHLNGVKVNLNPAKTYDTPYLSMVHGESKAIISYPGYKDLILDFNKNIK